LYLFAVVFRRFGFDDSTELAAPSAERFSVISVPSCSTSLVAASPRGDPLRLGTDDRLLSRNKSERDRATDSRSQSLVAATVPRNISRGQT